PQVVEIWVTGPDGANRLYLCSGNVNIQFQGYQAGQQQRDSFTFLVGPQFARQEVVRATCASGISGFNFTSNVANQGYATITNADADWDDESGKVQVKVDAELYGTYGIRGFDYNVMILAQKPEQREEPASRGRPARKARPEIPTSLRTSCRCSGRASEDIP